MRNTRFSSSVHDRMDAVIYEGFLGIKQFDPNVVDAVLPVVTLMLVVASPMVPSRD